MNHRINIIDVDKFAKALSEMTCGNVRFAEISAEYFEIPFSEVKQPEGYVEPDNFPTCCTYHKGIFNSLEEWYGKFPNCCEPHKRLTSTKWFVKDNYHEVALKVVKQLSYTEYIIEKKINSTDWYEDITDYIDYNVSSFGQLPNGFGSSVGLNNYLQNLKFGIENNTKKDYKAKYGDKSKKIVEYIESFDAPKGRAKIDLNILDTTYKNWLKVFPFGISYFKELKTFYEAQLPILKDKPTQNRYSGVVELKVLTQADLIEFLVSTTKMILSNVSSIELIEKGVIADSNKHSLELLNQDHKAKQVSLLGNYSKGESEYVIVIKNWLKNEKVYFESLSKLILAKNGSTDMKDVTRVKLQIPPIANEDVFEDFVCELYNSIYPDGHFHRFGKKGNNQKGIDLISNVRREAIQCKKKEITRKRLAEELKSDFENDVKSAIDLTTEIDLLIFASTFDDSSTLSEYLQDLKKGYNVKFNLMYIGWQSLSTLAQNYPLILNKYFGIPTPSLETSKIAVDNFRKSLPKTYLNNLPKIKYKAYIDAHKLWDTGITSEMLGGNQVLSDHLRKILIDLAEMVYTVERFDGKSATQYYESKINKLMEAAYDAQPSEPGTMHIVMASGQMAEILDELILQIIKDITDSAFFNSWIIKWNTATEAGREGREINLDLTDEL